jgi:hypothetical protein
MGKNALKRNLIVGIVSLFILIIGSISVTASMNEIVQIPAKNGDQVQHLFIIGTIKNINNSSFNLIFFYGKVGFYISVGWKGGYVGRIRDSHFTIYEDSFHGFINEHFIIGTAIQQSGPFGS